MTVSGLTSMRALRHSGQRRRRATNRRRSHVRSEVCLCLFRWRTASWCRRAKISTWSEARVRSVDVNPASNDISTSHMVHDVSSGKCKDNIFNRYGVFSRHSLPVPCPHLNVLDYFTFQLAQACRIYKSPQNPSGFRRMQGIGKCCHHRS